MYTRRCVLLKRKHGLEMGRETHSNIKCLCSKNAVGGRWVSYHLNWLNSTRTCEQDVTTRWMRRLVGFLGEQLWDWTGEFNRNGIMKKKLINTYNCQILTAVEWWIGNAPTWHYYEPSSGLGGGKFYILTNGEGYSLPKLRLAKLPISYLRETLTPNLLFFWDLYLWDTYLLTQISFRNPYLKWYQQNIKQPNQILYIKHSEHSLSRISSIAIFW